MSFVSGESRETGRTRETCGTLSAHALEIRQVGDFARLPRGSLLSRPPR